MSSAVMANPVPFWVPITSLPTRSLKSLREFESAKMAINSLATVISIPVFLGGNLLASFLPSPIVISLTNLSLQSTTLLIVIESGSMSNFANFSTSSSVRSSGFVLLIPNFCNLFNIDGVKFLLPFFAGTSLL